MSFCKDFNAKTSDFMVRAQTRSNSPLSDDFCITSISVGALCVLVGAGARSREREKLTRDITLVRRRLTCPFR
jgi:hypothetical protein